MHQFRAQVIAIVVCAAFLGGFVFVLSEFREVRAGHFAAKAELARAPERPVAEPEPEEKPERYVAPAPVAYPIY